MNKYKVTILFNLTKLMDEIFVINVNAYIGDSIRTNIDYAMALNKK